MVLLIDNYDSFSYNLLDYLQQAGAAVSLYKNDQLSPEKMLELQPDGILLSPGPGRPEQAGALMQILKTAVDARIPTLGICLGLQAIGLHFGAKLVEGPAPVHGKTAQVFKTDLQDPMLAGSGDPFEVMRYHSLVLEELEATELQVSAQTQHGIPMCIRHPKLAVNGFQFHPESIGTPMGLLLLKNWVKLLNNTSFIDE